MIYSYPLPSRIIIKEIKILKSDSFDVLEIKVNNECAKYQDTNIFVSDIKLKRLNHSIFHIAILTISQRIYEDTED